MIDTCVCCGREIPEGRQVCPTCERFGGPDAILKDGTPLYLKTSSNPSGLPLQLQLYQMLFGENKEKKDV